jgi:hypothetical protein
MMNGDVALIERLLDNLIENAIRYTPPQGLIRVTLTLTADDALLLVADSGRVISEDDITGAIRKRARRVPVLAWLLQSALLNSIMGGFRCRVSLELARNLLWSFHCLGNLRHQQACSDETRYLANYDRS